MEIKEIREIIKSSEYNFLRNNEHLGNNIILLTVGGSHAYGLNKEGSDLDIRGCAINSKKEILLRRDFNQVKNDATDTLIYSFDKLVSFFCGCNPNVVEMLGLRPEHYLFISPIGQELLDNKNLFLSQRAIRSFDGYAFSQLYGLEQKTLCVLSEKEFYEHICKVINGMLFKIKDRYGENVFIKVFAEEDGARVQGNIDNLSLADLSGLLEQINSVLKVYKKNPKERKNIINKEATSKLSVNLIRLRMMGIDILEKQEIIAFREKEHDLLMDIRLGKYLNSDGKPNSAFFDIVREYEKKFDYAKNNTELPEEPDMDKINDFVMSVNERIVEGNAFN